MVTPGATCMGDGRCLFTVWAPLRERMELKIVSPQEQIIPMTKDGQGYWSAVMDSAPAGTKYMFRIDGTRDRPDPASHYQPLGVHEASEVVDHRSFTWHDEAWRGVDLESTVFYELHVGIFTPEGTFDAIIPRLDELRDSGITTLEIMPVSQFPGDRNWGYDGAYPYAVQNSYGGPEGFKRLIDACHQKGLAVVLDVVYNHFGPEGSYIGEYGPYYTDEYKTPWGNAINFDGPLSDEVRTYFLQNALHWFTNYHLDGLRLDAIHAIYDTSARPFLQKLTELMDRFDARTGRRFLLIAESDLNDVKVLRPRDLGGFGMDAQWSDDLHHSMQTLVKTEEGGYYVDFGRMEHLAKAYGEGFCYSGEYSPYRRKRFGNTSAHLPGRQFVVCTQNHDQVGNRLLGERLIARVSFEAAKLAAGLIFLSPYVPLLFMGEEYGDETPFVYFVSHSDSVLIDAIRKGRREEFKAFQFQGEAPDAASEESFTMSKLHWEKRCEGRHGVTLEFYKTILRMRREIEALRRLEKEDMRILYSEKDRTMSVRRWHESSRVVSLFNVSDKEAAISPEVPAGRWHKVLDSADPRWQGPGTKAPASIGPGDTVHLTPWSFAVYQYEENS